MNWPETASADAGQITEWWKRWPRANVAVVIEDGMVALDIDHRNGGRDSLDRLMAAHRMPKCPMFVTGNGLRALFRDTTGLIKKTGKRLGPGIDVLAGGRCYSIMPGSVHPNGSRYTWLKGCTPVETRGLPLLPSTVVELLVDKPKPKRLRRGVARSTRVRLASGMTTYGRTALTGLIDSVASAAQGERHATIYKSACRLGELIRAGDLPAVESCQGLFDAGMEVCSDKYSERDVERWVRDGVLRPARGGAA